MRASSAGVGVDLVNGQCLHGQSPRLVVLVLLVVPASVRCGRSPAYQGKRLEFWKHFPSGQLGPAWAYKLGLTSLSATKGEGAGTFFGKVLRPSCACDCLGPHFTIDLPTLPGFREYSTDPVIMFETGWTREAHVGMQAFARHFTLNNADYSQSLPPSPHAMAKGRTIKSIDEVFNSPLAS